MATPLTIPTGLSEQDKLAVSRAYNIGIGQPGVPVSPNTSNPNFSGVTTDGSYATAQIDSKMMNPSGTTNFQTPQPTPASSMPQIPQPTVAETQKLGTQEQAISDMIKGLIAEPSLAAEKTAYQIEQEKGMGLADLQKNEADYTAQLKQLEADYKNVADKMQLEAEGRGITTGGLAPITMSEQRRLSVRANTVSALLAATQGKIAYAEAQVKKAVADKFAIREAERQTKLDNLALMSKDPTLTLEQQKRADARTKALQAEEKADTKKKEDTQTILDWAVKAAQSGATAQQAQAIMEIGLSNNPDLNKAFSLYSPFVKTVTEWSEPYLLGGDYVQKNKKTGEIRTAVNVPVGPTPPKNVFEEATNTFKQYKDEGYTRPEIETEWRKQNAASDGTPYSGELPLVTKRALDNLFGEATTTPVSTTNDFKWYNPLTWF